MGQQATAEAVRNWTLNLRDPADCLTNKAALLEREASFWIILSLINETNLEQRNQEKVFGYIAHFKVNFALFLLILSMAFHGSAVDY